MATEKIQQTALGVPRRGEEIFVSKLYDSHEKEHFYRPVGGGIEFGERSSEAVQREFLEELGLSVEVADFLGVIENLYSFNGEDGHEVVFVYETTVPDRLGGDVELEGHDDGQTTYTASWMTLADFDSDDVLLYPDSLQALLTGDSIHEW